VDLSPGRERADALKQNRVRPGEEAAVVSKEAKPLQEIDDKAERELSEIPAKSGLAGTLLVILIVTGILGIIILGIILLAKK
jgi:hypothetical protein